MRLCSRRRKLLRNLLILAVLSFSMCLFILSYFQHTNLELDKQVMALALKPNGFVNKLSQREILNFDHAWEQDKNMSHEIQKEFSTVLLLSDAIAQTSAVPVTDDSLCVGPWPNHPECQNKMNWMEGNWKKDPCYAEHGVNDTPCSFQDYLSLVEHFCPPRPGKIINHPTSKRATVNSDLAPLLNELNRNPKFDWIKRRIQSLWPQWTDALKQLEMIRPFQHREKKILIHIGALSDKSKFHLAETADHGGPLGELVQWSDLISIIHLLGHQIVFSTEPNALKHILPGPSNSITGGCPTGREKDFSAIFTDIVGFKQFKSAMKSQLQHYLCLFRVLDSFGTEPQFNYKPWKSNNKYKKQSWGNLGLNPRQFMTMYPHTPDNSFLGFVVGSNRTNSLPPPEKKNIGLVYGKELYMWKGHHNYLDTVSKYIDIHSTIGTTTQKDQNYDISTVVPGFVSNHGILNRTALIKLLKESKLFIGFGFPYEGPAPLEAIANGCFFLNPRFDKPLNRENTKFFKDKPTLRGLTSQNPYTEHFIGKPYVYTVDILNLKEVNKALQDMLSKEPLPPYIPYEYTYEGMLERVSVYLEYQDHCSHVQWPPPSALVAKVSRQGESCKEACYREGLVCEPELFPLLNTEEALKNHDLKCSTVSTENSIHGPSIDSSGRCSLQEQRLLLSCVGEYHTVKRLCPCRTFRKGQVALCSECVR